MYGFNKLVTNILDIIYPRNKEEALQFREVATEKKRAKVKENTKSLIEYLRDEIDSAITAGKNKIYYYPKDMENYFNGEDSFDHKEVLKWLQEWAQYDGYYLGEFGGEDDKHYVLEWDYVDFD